MGSSRLMAMMLDAPDMSPRETGKGWYERTSSPSADIEAKAASDIGASTAFPLAMRGIARAATPRLTAMSLNSDAAKRLSIEPWSLIKTTRGNCADSSSLEALTAKSVNVPRRIESIRKNITSMARNSTMSSSYENAGVRLMRNFERQGEIDARVVYPESTGGWPALAELD